MDRRSAQNNHNDQHDQRNQYSDQCNPNHPSDGPGRKHAYQGAMDDANLNNHSNQLNQNNKLFIPKK